MLPGAHEFPPGSPGIFGMLIFIAKENLSSVEKITQHQMTAIFG